MNGMPANNPIACVIIRPEGRVRTNRSASAPPVITPITEAICRNAVLLNPAIESVSENLRNRNDGSQVRNTAATKFAPTNTAISTGAIGCWNTSAMARHAEPPLACATASSNAAALRLAQQPQQHQRQRDSAPAENVEARPPVVMLPEDTRQDVAPAIVPA